MEAVHDDFEGFPAWLVGECGVAVGFLVEVRQHCVDDFLGHDARVFVVEVDLVGYAFVEFEEFFDVFNHTVSYLMFWDR